MGSGAPFLEKPFSLNAVLCCNMKLSYTRRKEESEYQFCTEMQTSPRFSCFKEKNIRVVVREQCKSQHLWWCWRASLSTAWLTCTCEKAPFSECACFTYLPAVQICLLLKLYCRIMSRRIRDQPGTVEQLDTDSSETLRLIESSGGTKSNSIVNIFWVCCRHQIWG